MTTSTYTVAGMTCGHCVNAVTEELGKLPGVREVVIDLASGSVTMSTEVPLPEPLVRAAVEEAGYELAGQPAS